MKTIEKKYYLPFALVSILFLLWGMANSMNDTLIAAFKRIMSMSDMQSSLIQFAFYGSYFCFALPAALFIRKYSYKSGIILGLSLYAAGTMLFYPASQVASYSFFLIALYVLAGGCSILETTANPYILSMGRQENATRRLNIAQSLNPLGCISGILVSQYFILSSLSSSDATERAQMTAEQLSELQSEELSAITGTYMSIGVVLIIIMCIMLMVKMPKTQLCNEGEQAAELPIGAAFKKLFANVKYRWGVVAQFAYVGAQTGVWSFTIRLAMHELGYNEKDAAFVFLISMICFCLARFFFTWLMKYYKPAKLMSIAALFAAILSIIVVTCTGTGWFIIVAVIMISFFMSLMFPTIYGIALDGVGEEAKIGASGLIMAILGGALITPLQGYISDMAGINMSFIIPAICFVIVLGYSLYVKKC